MMDSNNYCVTVIFHLHENFAIFFFNCKIIETHRYKVFLNWRYYCDNIALYNYYKYNT